MTKRLYTASLAGGLLLALITVATAFGQGGPGGRGKMMGDAAHQADMQLFHQLFERRAEITRQVIARGDGIDSYQIFTRAFSARYMRSPGFTSNAS